MSNSFTSVFSAGGGTDATKLPLAGGTLTGALINSANGAASAPVVSLTGTTFTGGTATTTKPTLIVEPTGTTSTGWSTSGTLIGANAATGFAGNLLDLQLNGAARFSVTSAGAVTASRFYVTGTTGIGSNAFGTLITSGNEVAAWSNATTLGFWMRGDCPIGFSSSNTPTSLAPDVLLYRTAAASLQLGASLVSGWVSQTLAAGGGRVGTDTNNSPTNTLTIAGSISTGTGTGGNLRLGVYGTNGTSGTAIGTLNTVLTVVAARKVINIAGIPTSASGLSSGDVYSNAGILTIVA